LIMVDNISMKVDNKISDIIIKNIKQHPVDVISFVAAEVGVSRQAVYKHLKHLLDTGQIVNNGTKRLPLYQLVAGHPQRKYKIFMVDKNLDEHNIWNDFVSPGLEKLKSKLVGICQYGFTEILNNVVDHSGAQTVKVTVSANAEIIMEIHDNGIGIFDKLKSFLQVSDEKEAILHLTKGKLTSDPSKHTGEGIFFTSRIFDNFEISSGTTLYTRFADNDWSVRTLDKKIIGTNVIMRIKANSDKDIKEIFKKYSNENFEFSTTEPLVELTLNKNETYISRSQAKRLLFNLDNFKLIILDFKNVEMLGQGFVDEVFRVYQNAHPQISLEYKNANADVEFMIKRGLSVNNA